MSYGRSLHISEPTLRCCLTKGLMVNDAKFWFLIGFPVSLPNLVSRTSSVFIPLTVSFCCLTCKLNLSARLGDYRPLGLLYSVSHKTNSFVPNPKELISCISVTWRSSLTSVLDDNVLGIIRRLLHFGALALAVLPDAQLVFDFVEGLEEKSLSAP